MNGLKRILLAEDDPNDVALTLKALSAERLANEVVAVRDGAETLDYLYRKGGFAARPAGHPAVVLLDLKLPKRSGLDVLAEMKTDPQLWSIPVVILTSSRQSEDVEKCYRLGVNAFIVKPVSFPDFMAAVGTAGTFWAVVNEPPDGTAPRRAA